jgi:hypothetical protein
VTASVREGRRAGDGIVSSTLCGWKCAFLRRLYARVPLAVGQMWAFESSDRSPLARLIVYRIDPDERHGEIVSIVPSGVWVPVLSNTQGEHALFLMTRSALRQTVTKLISRDTPFPDVEGEYRRFLDGYRGGEAGVYDMPLKHWLTVYRILGERGHL